MVYRFPDRNNGSITSDMLARNSGFIDRNKQVNSIPSQQLAKAKLFSLDSQEYDVEFMFNPTQLDLSRSIKLNQPQGARSKQGQPKVSFAAPEPGVITLSKIIFDTYEEGDSVLNRYINKLLKAVKFIDKQKRPPIYIFLWGANDYLASCFVESIKYQLTMFLPDGTPVRALVNLTLKEVDASVVQGERRQPQYEDRFGDSIETRLLPPQRNRADVQREQELDKRNKNSNRPNPRF